MISFVYFDVGGVAILDFSGTNKWELMKSDMGIHEKNHAQFDTVWNRYREKICIDCDVDSLLPTIEKEVGLHLPKNYSMLTDFVNRFEANPSIWPIIEKVKITHRIGLLTNMYPRMFSAIQLRNILPPVEWDSIIDSSIVGYQKPDREIFHIAEQKSHVKKSEILFIDNSIEHIEAAQKIGWQTFLYDSAKPGQSSTKLAELLFS